MKQSIYQKLLMSLTIVAFFATLASAQVMSRDQVSPEMIEMKKKAKAQGLTAIPAEWIEEANQIKKVKLSEVSARTANTKTVNANKKAVQKSAVERKLVETNQQSIYERAKQITPPPGYKVGIHTVGGKQYIEFMELPDQGTTTPARVKN